MNIKKAKKKAKTKAKAKVAKKLAKKVAACAVILLAVAGCQSVPSRSQTLTIKDCTINVYKGNAGSDTNLVAAVEIGTQTMAIENSGTETQSPTQTTDTKPDVDVSVGAAQGGGILETAAAAGVKRLLAPTANAVGTGSSASVTASGCEDGSCSPGCTDGSCSEK